MTFGCDVVADVTADVAVSSLVVVVVAGMGTIHHGQRETGSRCGRALGSVGLAHGGKTSEAGWG